MFENLRAKSRKHRRRKSMRLKKGRGPRGSSRMRASNILPILKIAGLFVAAAGLVLLIIFVFVPLVFGDGKTEEVVVEVSATSTPTATPIARADMSGDVKELQIDYDSVNDPYVCGNEVVFSTGSDDNIDTIAVYNIETEETTKIDKITMSYFYLFEPSINENFIVYLDCKDEYGGAVCGYDRNTGEMFVMREYKFGKPKVTLAGDYALWMQQTSLGTDRLYLYYLPTQESVEIEVFVNTYFSVSAAYLSDDAFIYVQPYQESLVLDGSADSDVAEICVIPLEEDGDDNRILFCPGTFVYNPMIDGDYIVYMDSTGDESSALMLCTKSGDTYSAPEVIAEGVLNYDVGDGYVAYTKDDAVYIYYFADGSSGRLSSETTRARLANANGKDVVWYDITGNIDDTTTIIMHIQVP
ncbi:MAG: hypothetical protein PHO15_00810 [Eubacteriales bacterium]|nr:hypothetical protein [Eubacteriales bacterium]